MATKQYRLLAEIFKQYSDLTDLGCFKSELVYQIDGVNDKFIDINIRTFHNDETVYNYRVDFKQYNYPDLCRELVRVAEEIYYIGENYEE